MNWRRSLPLLLVAAMGTSGLADVASTNSIDRYKVIVEKSPFKRFSEPNTSPSGPPAGNLALSGIVVSGKEKKVFLRDNGQNKSFCVGEGEMVGDYRVVKIDAESQSVELNRGVETFSVKFAAKSAASPLPVPSSTAVTPSTSTRPVYRNPRVAMPAPMPVQAPVAPPPPSGTTPMPLNPAVTSTPASDHPTPPSNTSLRRRILQRNLRPQPPAENPAPKEEAKEAKEGEAAAEEAQALQ